MKLTSSSRLNHLLANMGIFSFYDVLNHLPRSYEDLSYTRERNLDDKERVVLIGKIVSPIRNVKNRIEISSFDFITRNRTYFKVVAYNRSFLTKVLNQEDEFTIIGSFDRKRNEINLINFLKGEVPQDKRIKPIYSLPVGYPQHSFVSLVNKSFKELEGHLGNRVPFEYIKKYKLCSRENALKWAHFPTDYQQVKNALRYLKYEEALFFSMKNQMIREQNKSLTKIKKEPIDITLCEDVISSLPYKLTEDQLKASEEIIEDMNQSSLMYRLLQGDVGTGKTLVSLIALYANYKRGDQGALMAPTDVLAKQHYENAKELFKGTKMNIALLVGATSQSEKKQIYSDLEDGIIDLVIGTHALFSKAVKYSSLGLVVIDEQHKFGVNQRIALADKGEHVDLLMMSATPIPRSLALTIYGDLDISTLYTFPNKKRLTKTKIIASEDEKIFNGVDWAIKNHRQVYIVSPLIEFRDDERYSVEKLFPKYALKYKGKVNYLTGKMTSEEKEQIIKEFASFEKSILISTSVIEVGIDVKTAGLMVIYDASNFSLASLHQLRGRIGRDGQESYCLLTIDKDDQEAYEKLDILTRSEDGFKIAEADLKLRGPGELTGFKQSGIPAFAYLNAIDDFKVFILARDDAKEIIASKSPEYDYLKNRIKQEIEYKPIIKG